MMLSQGQELAALDFAQIIGGPLNAVINAQANAANLTAGFIQSVGFQKGGAGGAQQLKTVSFDFSQFLGSPGQAGGSSIPSGMATAFQIKVPLLTMIPIPFIRVDSMTIQLNVKLVSATSTQVNNALDFGTTDEAGESGIFGMGPSADLKATVTDQNTFQNNQIVNDTYNLDVTVHAVQDQMPAGMAQILNIFSNCIQTQASLIQTAMTAQVQKMQQAISAPAGQAGSSGQSGPSAISSGIATPPAPPPPIPQ
jgi:hypothetical protein